MMETTLGKIAATTKDGLRFGLLMGLSMSLLDIFYKGLHLTAVFSHLFFCSLGALIGAFSYRGLVAYHASRKLRQQVDKIAGDGI